MSSPSDILSESSPRAVPARRSPDILALVSIAACASALVGLARQILGQAIATRLMATNWFSSSSTLAQMNSPVRLAGACGTLATVALGGVAAMFVRTDKRLTAGWFSCGYSAASA